MHGSKAIPEETTDFDRWKEINFNYYGYDFAPGNSAEKHNHKIYKMVA